MIKIVFDTNTLVSASLSKRSVSRQAFGKAINVGTLLGSNETIVELGEVIFRSKFDKLSPVESREIFYLNFVEQVTILPVELKLHDCRDPKDNKFLELAVTGNADVIVTGDKDLLVLHPYRDIPILNSASFLEWLSENG